MDRNDPAFGVLAEQKKWMRCPRCHHFVELIEDALHLFATSVEDRSINIGVIVEVLLCAVNGAFEFLWFSWLFVGSFLCFRVLVLLENTDAVSSHLSHPLTLI
ncbi:hypothetical protein ACH5RR_002376 [Cinchona calisaya]|uniref:Uncharacterized protein n=1 Tax=Cinchona calisaya TaxID=153742 RepID=A0ABD3B630_9GENT